MKDYNVSPSFLVTHNAMTVKRRTKMIKMSIKRNLIVGLSATITLAWVSSAMAQSEYTSYSTTKGGCTSEHSSEALIYWTPSTISGPGFACILNGSVPVGTGLAGHQSICYVAGKELSGIVVFGAPGPPPNDDHFGLELPNARSFEMYPCTPVGGVTGTN
jgi:hypothetical protein